MPDQDSLAAGNALFYQGRLAEAVAAYRLELNQRPGQSRVYNNLGIALAFLGNFSESEVALRKALAIAPQDAEVYKNLAGVLYRLFKLDEAEAAGLRSVTLRPDYAQAYVNLAAVAQGLGKIDDAIVYHDRIAALAPRDAAAASNRILAIQLSPAFDAQSLLTELKRWNQCHAEPLQSTIRPVEIDRNPNRRLRIGYVSADFRDHVIARCALPLLRDRDRDRFEVFCYGAIVPPDLWTERFRALCDGWRDISRLDEQSTANLIRQDRIDVLVDLSCHTAGNRLMVFARKPAPVQVTFLGYPGSTGLSGMDWRLTDPYLDPPGQNDADYTEKSHRLPDTFWCLDPQTMEVVGLQVSPLPAATNGHVTFGCLCSFSKVNDVVLDLWKRVMDQTPGCRLRMLAPPGSPRDRIPQKLGPRVDFVPNQPRQAYLTEYDRIDIFLDTIPYNGHTTSLESLWMGVPVVTRVGKTVFGRGGASQLSNLKLTELIATSDEQFVQIASDLAADLPRLAELRRTLRQRMLDSPLTDAAKYTRGVEAAYLHFTA